jgi:hypothetical protein
LDAGLQQVLFKIRWIPIKTGGFIRGYEEEEKGMDLMRLVTVEEVKPNVKYYMKSATNKMHFMETSFHNAVSWDTIMEFINTNQIYTKHGNERKVGPTERAPVRTDSPRLF